MLREYLCLQNLIGVLVVTLVLLAAYILPIGFALNSVVRSVPVWIPSMVIILVLVALLMWTFFSTKELIPSRFAPWAFSRQTVWLDKCCINQDSTETIKAGVDAFDRFIKHCDGMVAFVSQSYFSRIWCVYELATFCKINEDYMTGKLLLYSLEWRSSLNPFRSAEMTEGEKSYFSDFSCRNARCYKPADRGFVLEEIRRHWGSEEIFDDFVRNELPVVFAESKRNYSRQLMRVANRSLELLFGA